MSGTAEPADPFFDQPIPGAGRWDGVLDDIGHTATNEADQQLTDSLEEADRTDHLNVSDSRLFRLRVAVAALVVLVIILLVLVIVLMAGRS